MTLPAEEFLRRYEQHILPPRFCKIRHYGLPGQLQTKERVNETAIDGHTAAPGAIG